MKVLWFSCTPSCYDVDTRGGWIEALEKVVCKYLPNVELAVVFEHHDNVFKVKRNGVTYYPIQNERNKIERIIDMFYSSSRKEYERLKPKYLRTIEDFKPDLIQCFGTEMWHYSLLQKEVKIPFVIHLMGFWNIYNMMNDIVSHKCSSNLNINFLRKLHSENLCKRMNEHMDMERESMRCCRYFMGRTEWDKKIVKYFSLDSIYFHCPEAIREDVEKSSRQWQFKFNDTIKLITISNAGILKGNEIMLRTAWILKHRFNKNVEWIYTTSDEAMLPYEKSTNIRCRDVGIKPIGRLNSIELSEALCSAQMFIHASIIDNSPNAICEAQLVGIPVVATNSGGIPQIVEDGVSGFLYPYSEPYALAFKIMELHNNKAVLTEISENERRISHERHNPELLANRLFEIYNNVIKINKSM